MGNENIKRNILEIIEPLIISFCPPPKPKIGNHDGKSVTENLIRTKNK